MKIERCRGARAIRSVITALAYPSIFLSGLRVVLVASGKSRPASVYGISLTKAISKPTRNNTELANDADTSLGSGSAQPLYSNKYQCVTLFVFISSER